jgi:hypothetical protein
MQASFPDSTNKIEASNKSPSYFATAKTSCEEKAWLALAEGKGITA